MVDATSEIGPRLWILKERTKSATVLDFYTLDPTGSREIPFQHPLFPMTRE